MFYFIFIIIEYLDNRFRNFEFYTNRIQSKSKNRSRSCISMVPDLQDFLSIFDVLNLKNFDFKFVQYLIHCPPPPFLIKQCQKVFNVKKKVNRLRKSTWNAEFREFTSPTRNHPFTNVILWKKLFTIARLHDFFFFLLANWDWSQKNCFFTFQIFV